ncbi:MAG TPA: 3D domain-containing protein [Gaiellaceae bacterium]|nr:3D domain-containing protein [Gaiellaceae bacterium]
MSGRRTRSLARLAALPVVLALAVSSAAAAGPGAGYRHRAAQLQVEAQKLDTRAHQALLRLYSLESRLGAARGRVAALSDRSARLRVRALTLSTQLDAARKTLAVSRGRLADRLRSLYEGGQPNVLAVVLGAESLDEAISKLDTLTRLADESRRIVAATDDARLRLVRVRARLAVQRRQLRAALAAARTAARELESARSERLAYVSSLRSRKQLKEAQIRGLLATARAVERKSEELVAAAPTTTSADDPAPAAAKEDRPAAASAPAPDGRKLRVSATGYSLPGHTASGMPVGWGVVAVDPRVIPLGTRMTVPGYGEAVAADVGSAVRGAMIDLWFPTLAQARAWGRRTVTITLH